MWLKREAIATTSLVGDNESEKGLLGRAIVAGTISGFEGWWMWSVESHDAEISSF